MQEMFVNNFINMSVKMFPYLKTAAFKGLPFR